MAKGKGLKRGFTTGTCAAAATKAALLSLITGNEPKDVEIILPVGRTVTFPVHRYNKRGGHVSASIIKDGGDDPDVTNGAEIVAEVRIQDTESRLLTTNNSQIVIEGGRGVGRVTKPGLAVPVGQPAINPVPIRMIRGAVKDALSQLSNPRFEIQSPKSQIYVTISAPRGEDIAKKTLNHRLGIIGGISILGTTGIVEPISTSVWKDTIICALDVAVACGLEEVVFSTGRSSEKGAEQILNLPEEAFILVGDYMEYALKEAADRVKGKGQRAGKGIKKVTIAGQFGKLTKMASGHFDTHVRDSTIDLNRLSKMVFETGCGEGMAEAVERAHTMREAFFIIQDAGFKDVFKAVSRKVCENAISIVEGRLGIGCMLIGYSHDLSLHIYDAGLSGEC